MQLKRHFGTTIQVSPRKHAAWDTKEPTYIQIRIYKFNTKQLIDAHRPVHCPLPAMHCFMFIACLVCLTFISVVSLRFVLSFISYYTMYLTVFLFQGKLSVSEIRMHIMLMFFWVFFILFIYLFIYFLFLFFSKYSYHRACQDLLITYDECEV